MCRATPEHHFYRALVDVPYANATSTTPPAGLKIMEKVVVGDLITIQQDVPSGGPVYYTMPITNVEL